MSPQIATILSYGMQMLVCKHAFLISETYFMHSTAYIRTKLRKLVVLVYFGEYFSLVLGTQAIFLE